jgi:hypothetical protein
MIERIRQPARKQSNGDVWSRIDEAYDPRVLLASTLSLAQIAGVRNAETLLERQVRAVRSSLVPVDFLC